MGSWLTWEHDLLLGQNVPDIDLIAAAGDIALGWEAVAKGYGVYYQAKPSLANQSSLLASEPWIPLPRFY